MCYKTREQKQKDRTQGMGRYWICIEIKCPIDNYPYLKLTLIYQHIHTGVLDLHTEQLIIGTCFVECTQNGTTLLASSEVKQFIT